MKCENVWKVGKCAHRSDEKKIARLKKLKDFCRVSQNGQAFMGRIGKVSLYEFTESYGMHFRFQATLEKVEMIIFGF
jgi:hypothetical protein